MTAIEDYIKFRDIALREGTAEAAKRLWDATKLGVPVDLTVPLAGLHKARILWRDATPEEVKTSQEWLVANGYKAPRRPAPEDYAY